MELFDAEKTEEEAGEVEEGGGGLVQAEEHLLWLKKKGGEEEEEEEGGRKVSTVRGGINLCCHGQISTKETNHPGSVSTAATSRHPGTEDGRIPCF